MTTVLGHFSAGDQLDPRQTHQNLRRTQEARQHLCEGRKPSKTSAKIFSYTRNLHLNKKF